MHALPLLIKIAVALVAAFIDYNSWMRYQVPSTDIEIVPEIKRQATEGPLYQVVIHNDDLTPMDFVVQILMGVFYLHGAHALQVMFNAHYHGSAYVQTLPKPEALKRIGLAHFSARMNGYPLEFTLRPEIDRPI